MKENIPKLEENLSTLRPKFYASIQQPLADIEINSLEGKYKMQIPSDLRALYKWKNG